MDRDFTEEERAKLAHENNALPDGSYPMPDCDAVRRAIDSYGRAPESHRKSLARLIIKRNNELSCGHEFTTLEEEAE